MTDYPHPTSSAVTTLMKANTRANTKPEVALRSALHAHGLRFRKDYLVPIEGARPTRIDIAFTRPRVAVFLDGCFWHGCPEHGHVPRANVGYWQAKLERNRRRDEAVTAALTVSGWKVLRVWEHMPVVDAVEAVLAAVGAPSQRHEDGPSGRDCLTPKTPDGQRSRRGRDPAGRRS